MNAGLSHAGTAGGSAPPSGLGARVGQVFLDVRSRQLFCLDPVARQLHQEGIPYSPADLEQHQLLTLAGRPVTSADLPLLIAWHEERPVDASFFLPGNKHPKQRITWQAAPVRDARRSLLGVAATIRWEALEPDWQALAGLAHDLRNPLNAITLQLAVLPPLGGDPNLARILGGLKSSAEQALRVGQDLLNWLRAPTQRGRPMELAWFSLEKLLADLTHEQALAARNKGLVLDTDFRACQGWEAHTDRIRLMRILSNLLANAIRYTPHGRVEFTASWRADASHRVLAIGVLDTGMGITAEEQESIFHPFERGRAGKESGDSSGSGLGLAVVDNLALELGLALEVHSEQGRGSAFHLLLPTTMLRRTSTSSY